MSIADSLLQTYHSGDLTVDARWVTWDLAVFEIQHRDLDGVVAVPRADLDSFVASLWEGRLDGALINEVRSPRTQRRRLVDGDDVTAVGVYGGVKDPSWLSPTERNVFTGRVGGSGGLRGRNAKRSSSSGGLVPVPKKSRTLVVAAVIAAVVLLAGAAVAMTGGDDKQDVAAVGTTTTTLVPLVTTPTTEAQASFRGQYEITVTVTSFETAPYGEKPSLPVFTSSWYCGDYLVTDKGDVKECGADPRYETSYFTPGFPIPDPDQESFTAKLPFPVCADAAPDGSNWRQGVEIIMNGYGTDEISGTIKSGYDVVSCPFANGGVGGGYKMTGTFVGHAVDGTKPPGATATTALAGATGSSDTGGGTAPVDAGGNATTFG